MITINTTPIQDPTEYNDNYDQFFSDNISLGLQRQRNRLGKKKIAEMTWKLNTPTELSTLLALFQEGAAVAFVNDASSFGTFSFTGIPDLPLDISDYEGGGTYMRSLKVVLKEV
jgi:hypothetical protein